MPKQLTHPTVHLNGTSKEELLRQLETACGAVRDAMEAVAQAAPNGRDYYVQGSHAYPLAAAEHEDRIARLRSVYDELETLALELPL